MQPRLDRGASWLADPDIGWLRVMARLGPGSAERQARAEMAVLLDQLKTEPAELGRRARDLSRVDVASGARGLSDTSTRLSPSLRILASLAGLVLLIACLNIANLLMCRATARRREVAIRLAIGAGWRRLVRQFLTESLVLACLGGAAGLLLAWWGGHLLAVLLSDRAGTLPISAAPNGRILLFNAVLSLSTGTFFGIVPALSAVRRAINPVTGRTPAGGGRSGVLRVLVVGQVALTLVLLTGAGLLVRTLNNLRNLELGFAAEHVLQVELEPESTGYTREQLAGLFERLTEKLRSAPGVISVSMAGVGYGTGTTATCCIAIEGFPHQAGEDRQFNINSVTPGYFHTLGLPILAGRDFDPRDVRRRSVESAAAMINQTMARKVLRQRQPCRSALRLGRPAEREVRRRDHRGRSRRALRPTARKAEATRLFSRRGRKDARDPDRGRSLGACGDRAPGNRVRR